MWENNLWVINTDIYQSMGNIMLLVFNSLSTNDDDDNYYQKKNNLILN